MVKNIPERTGASSLEVLPNSIFLAEMLNRDNRFIHLFRPKLCFALSKLREYVDRREIILNFVRLILTTQDRSMTNLHYLFESRSVLGSFL